MQYKLCLARGQGYAARNTMKAARCIWFLTLVCGLNFAEGRAEVNARFSVEFAALIGGSEYDDAREIIILPDGSLLLGGQTVSADFPVTEGAAPDALQKTYGGNGDGVFAIMSADGSRLLYATYLGGAGEDLLRSLAIDQQGNVFLIGKTASADFPVTDGAAQTKVKGKLDAFVVKLARRT